MPLSTRLCVLSPEGEILFTSQGWKDFVLKSSSPYASLLKTGKNLLEIEEIPPFDPVGLLQTGVRAVLEGGKIEFNYEFTEKVKAGSRSIRIEVIPLSAPYPGCQVVVHDISAQKSVDLESNFFKEFQKLISEISSRLVSSLSSKLDQNITKALEEVARLTHADYSFVTQLSEDRSTTSMTHFWHSDPPPDFYEAFQKVPLANNPFIEKLTVGEVFLFSVVQDIPEVYTSYREQCLRLGVKSAVVVPVSVEGVFEAYIGLVATQRQRSWTDREVMILRVLSEIFGSAFHRKKIEATLRQREKRMLAFFQATEDPVWCYVPVSPIAIHLPTERQFELLSESRLAECNDACARLYGFKESGELLGRTAWELAMERSESLQELVRNFIESGYRVIDGRTEENLFNGERKFMLHQVHGIVENGHLVRAWGTTREISSPAQRETAGERSVDETMQYRNSRLSSEEIAKFTAQVERIMKEEKPYLESSFNLGRLSKLLRLPDYQVSQVLNMGLGASFYDLVNRYRIDELLELMNSPAYDEISILDLAYRVGFNSKSSFNTAFKKLTGKTPSSYRAESQAARAPA